MNLNRYDLNLFVVFDTIFREQSLTRAGEALSISQPSVSNALSRLRVMFGDQLFIRSGRKMLPTPAAKSISAQVKEALKLMQQSIDSTGSFDPASDRRSFSVSMNNILQGIYMPGIYRQIHARAPHMVLRILTSPRDELVSELAAGKVDVAVDGGFLADSDLYSRRLFSDRYVCVVRHDHPLVSDSLDVDQYLALQHVHSSGWGEPGIGCVDIALKKMGQERGISLTITNHQSVFPLVAQSDLAATVPRSLAKSYDLKILELPVKVAKVETFLYWHESADQDEANRWVREQIVSYVDSVAGEEQGLGKKDRSSLPIRIPEQRLELHRVAI
ncbi:LysR family transcriptional regulator [Microbulbifer hainanensis]|uniref:LysR family transcriptional regulator n=1 Tax=Microbulbifer hainanensis TaxID=2735675 RepID=UPI001867F57C|nr:LysR family transcriptional regulator [Microbulbifer hainanensis]